MIMHFGGNMEQGLVLQIDAGYISVAEFARRTGQTERAVRYQCQEGNLPIRKRTSNQDKYFINNALIIKQALEQEY